MDPYSPHRPGVLETFLDSPYTPGFSVPWIGAWMASDVFGFGPSGFQARGPRNQALRKRTTYNPTWFSADPLKNPDHGYVRNMYERARARVWAPRTAEEIEKLAGQKAYRTFQNQVVARAGRAATRAQGSGAVQMGKKFFGSITRQLATEGMGGWWGMTKFGVGLAGRLAMPVMTALFVSDIVQAGAGSFIDTMVEMGRPKDVTPRYYHTPMNYTMRSAGLQAIASGQMSTRNALGREASIIHG